VTGASWRSCPNRTVAPDADLTHLPQGFIEVLSHLSGDGLLRWTQSHVREEVVEDAARRNRASHGRVERSLGHASHNGTRNRCCA
jgi:hypothetical protein